MEFCNLEILELDYGIGITLRNYVNGRVAIEHKLLTDFGSASFQRFNGRWCQTVSLFGWFISQSVVKHIPCSYGYLGVNILERKNMMYVNQKYDTHIYVLCWCCY